MLKSIILYPSWSLWVLLKSIFNSYPKYDKVISLPDWVLTATKSTYFLSIFLWCYLIVIILLTFYSFI